MAIHKEDGKDYYVSVTEKDGKEQRVRFKPVINSDEELDDLRRRYVETIKKRIKSGEEKEIKLEQIEEQEESWFPNLQEEEECVG